MRKNNQNTQGLVFLGAAAIGALIGYLMGQSNSSPKPIPQTTAVPTLTVDDHELVFCPISGEKMKSPYVLDCGHSFEEAKIKEWMKKYNTCPICRKNINNVSPNYQLKELI